MEMKSLFILGLAQQLGSGLGIILGIGFLASCTCLVASALSGFGERSIAGIKVSLVLAIICGLAYVIVQAIFQAGGVAQTIAPTAIN
jgi:lipopolysaccharide export LptBFGC system permease protein LptF